MFALISVGGFTQQLYVHEAYIAYKISLLAEKYFNCEVKPFRIKKWEVYNCTCNLISHLLHVCPVYVRSHLGTAVRVVEEARVLCVACDGLLLVWGTTEHRYWFCSVSQQPFLSPFTEMDFTLLWRFFEAHPQVYLLIWKTVNVSELIHFLFFF